MQQRPKKGWPRKADMPARYHAALVAVRLFRHHALEPTASHSLNNKVLPLAKIIFGEPQSSTGETDKGWFQQINRAIKETSIRSRTATTINDADRRLSARQSRLFPKP
jgi:hypothetical protein